jgi:hypothetical protein
VGDQDRNFDYFKFSPGAGRNLRILPGKETRPIIDFVDIGQRTFTTLTHKDHATIGECFLCDHDKESKYTKFRDTMMNEAVREI